MAYKTYDTAQKPGESIEHYYRRLAKAADQRLVRLERLAEQEYYQGASKWAYNRAQKDIQRWGSGSRFNTAPPDNTNSLKAKINDIKAFLEAPTSTKSGITDVYQRRADTINKTYGTNLSWEDIAEFYGREKNVALDAKYGSKQVAMAIGVIQNELKSGKTIKDLQSDARKRAEPYEFTYKTKKGEVLHDFILDDTVHRILRSKNDIAAMYDLLIRHA